MKRILKKAIIIMIITYFLLSVFLFQFANAESTGNFYYKSLNVQVFPEYTKHPDATIAEPALLIGYHAAITNNTGEVYGGNIEIPVPITSPNFIIGYIGEYAKDGSMVDVDYAINKDNGTVVWVPGNQIGVGEDYNFILEYYYTPFEKTDIKAFNYQFIANADIDKANIIFYQPLGAEDFNLTPATNFQMTNDYGMDLYMFEYSQVKKGEVRDFQINYHKSDNITSLERLEELQPPNDDIHAGLQPEGENSINNKSIASGNNALMISISIIILGFFIYLGLKNRNNKPSNESKQIQEDSIVDEVRKLRTMYINGEIDEKTYLERRAKLTSGGV